MSAKAIGRTSKPSDDPGGYDHGKRRRGVRKGREQGCWVYIPQAELIKADRYTAEHPPHYRLWATERGGVMVRLYDKP